MVATTEHTLGDDSTHSGVDFNNPIPFPKRCNNMITTCVTQLSMYMADDKRCYVILVGHDDWVHGFR